MSDESPLDRFKSVLAGTARALSHDAEIEVAWTADTPIQNGKNFRIPMPGRNLPREQAMEARGFADSFTLKVRHHNEQLHARNAPAEPTARACYDAVETVRYEALGANAYQGMRDNLDAALAWASSTPSPTSPPTRPTTPPPCRSFTRPSMCSAKNPLPRTRATRPRWQSSPSGRGSWAWST